MTARIVILAVVLIAGAAYVEHASSSERVALKTPLAALPLTIAGWQGREAEPFPAAVPKGLGADDHLNRIYEGPDGQMVALYVGYYGSQRNRDAIDSPMNCLPGAGWQLTEHARIAVQVATLSGVRRTIIVNQYHVQRGGDQQVLLYWYQSRGRVLTSEQESRAYAVYDAMRHERTDGALVRVLSPLRESDPGARRAVVRQLVGFVQAVFPRLNALLPA